MFTSLPVEVRLLIFEHLFSSNLISINAGLLHGVLVEQWDLPWEILATSKRNHHEALMKFKIRLNLSLPRKYWENQGRIYTADVSYHLSSHLRSAVTTLSLEGGVTGAYLHPLELFPNLGILRLRSSIPSNGVRPMTAEPTPPRLTYQDLLLAHADTAYRQSALTTIACDMLEDLVLQHNPRLATDGIRTFFWHTTKFHVDHGETYIRPMIEFVYDSKTDTVRGVHVRRTRVSSSTAERSTSNQVACVICEFRSKMGVPVTSKTYKLYQKDGDVHVLSA